MDQEALRLAKMLVQFLVHASDIPRFAVLLGYTPRVLDASFLQRLYTQTSQRSLSISLPPSPLSQNLRSFARTPLSGTYRY